MQRNYPDYKRISQIEKELSEIKRKIEKAHYWDEEDSDKEDDLEEELDQLIMGERVEVEGKSCKENHCSGGPVYYPGKVHHLDGNHNNDSIGNLAMVCPYCQAHILLSINTPENIGLLKARGLSNADIGRHLGISRERVRQLYNEYKAKEMGLTANINDLVKKAQEWEKFRKFKKNKKGRYTGPRKGKRLTDRRTLKKRIIAELNSRRKGK